MSGVRLCNCVVATWSVVAFGVLTPNVVAQARSVARSAAPRAILILDLAGNGISLTTPFGGVLFDQGGGHSLKTAWTRQGADDAFIVVELKQNGVVEGVRELVGGDGPPNGFDYLRALERARGTQPPTNGARARAGGATDAQDPVFPRVLIWTDTNHNGVSEAIEMQSFAYAGFLSIDLNTEKVDERDSSGSLIREKGTAVLKTRGGVQRRTVIAVELAREQ